MGVLDGKTALIFGVANDHSIAWGIAKALHEHGATVGFSSVESLIEKRVRPLADSIGSTFVEPCDVQSDEQIRAVMAKWKAAHGEIDILVHALAFANQSKQYVFGTNVGVVERTCFFGGIMQDLFGPLGKFIVGT